MSAPKIRGVLWDIDGTLLDSNDAHAHAYEQALAALKIPQPFAKIRQLIGMGGDHLLPTLIGAPADSDIGTRVSQLKTAIFDRDYFPRLQPFAQAKLLVTTLHARGYRMGVASSAAKAELHRFLDRIGIRRCMYARTSADDVESSKPDPDVIQAALGRLELSPSEVMMIGDTPYDIEAAFKAGVPTIAFRCGGWDDRALQGAAVIYDGPAQMLENLPELFEGADAHCPNHLSPLN